MSNEQPDPRHSRLVYAVGQTLEPLALRDLCEKWDTLVASGMPGHAIESITYETGRWELVVTFK